MLCGGLDTEKEVFNSSRLGMEMIIFVEELKWGDMVIVEFDDIVARNEPTLLYK